MPTITPIDYVWNFEGTIAKVRAKSVYSGEYNEMEIPITKEQFEDWKKGNLIQNAFPQLTADQREFLLTGITPEEWRQMFPAKEE